MSFAGHLRRVEYKGVEEKLAGNFIYIPADTYYTYIVSIVAPDPFRRIGHCNTNKYSEVPDFDSHW